MYHIYCETDGTKYELYNPQDTTGEQIVTDPVLTLEVGKSGTLTFTIAANHPYKDKIKALSSEITVYSDAETEPIFAGRHIGDEKDFYNSGKVTCEGELSYLCDSVQRPFTSTSNGGPFLEECLTTHNSQVEERKQFKLGTVSVADPSGEVERTIETADTTMNVLKSQLIEVSEGNLRVRRSNGVKYIDYLDTYGDENTQVIEFSKNLIDMTRSTDPTQLFTVLVPYGAEDDEGNRIDITSVTSDGKDYIVDTTAVATYGYIWHTETFDDCTDASQLLKKAQAYLSEATAIETTVEVTAVDMSLLDSSEATLNLGCYTRVVSEIHDFDEKMILNKKVLYLDSPEKDTYTFGATLQTFTGSDNDNKFEVGLKVDSISGSLKKDIDRKIDNATQLITGGNGGYIYTHLTSDGHPDELVIMDQPSLTSAKNVIRLNKNGIGFSTTGYTGTFKNAWTIDGNLVADFVTTGTMLADRIRGGSLEVGGTGTGKDGSITIYDSSGNKVGTFNKSGIWMKGKIECTSGGKIGGFSIDGDSLVADDDDCSIQWGDLSIDGTQASVGELYVETNLYTGGLTEEDLPDNDGSVYVGGEDLYIVGDGTFSGRSNGILHVYEDFITLYDYVHNGGWNGSTCDYCDEVDECTEECTEEKCEWDCTGNVYCACDGCDESDCGGCDGPSGDCSCDSECSSETSPSPCSDSPTVCASGG